MVFVMPHALDVMSSIPVAANPILRDTDDLKRLVSVRAKEKTLTEKKSSLLARYETVSNMIRKAKGQITYSRKSTFLIAERIRRALKHTCYWTSTPLKNV